MTQTVDINAQILCFSTVFRSPNTLQQHAMGKHLTDVGDKLLQKGELCWRQPNFCSSQAHDMPRKVDLEVAKMFYAACGWRRFPLGTAQHSAHTGEEFFHPKRLGQVIVSTEIERSDLVAFSVQCGQHDDGHGRVFADTLTDFEAVHARHHDV